MQHVASYSQTFRQGVQLLCHAIFLPDGDSVGPNGGCKAHRRVKKKNVALHNSVPKKNLTKLKGVIDYNTVLTRIAICVLVLTTWE